MQQLKFLFLFFVLSIFTFERISAQHPDTEIRAVWLTTNWNLDWPSPSLSPENQQKQLGEILDRLQEANFNTIFFQVRIRGDVFYPSQLEPWSPYIFKNKPLGVTAAYDPLAYAVQECHRRGLECHAWVVTFPLGSKKQVDEQGRYSVVARYPRLCKLYKDEWYLDPGNPEARSYILKIVDEIVDNYDIDGIHFDYIRYPDDARKFPDNDTFTKYRQGKSLPEWRRNNINLLVSDIYDRTKHKKPWVQVSCSPIGKYKDLDPRKGTYTAYSSVYQDAGKWMMEGKMDAVYPMMYYNNENFRTYIEEWIKTSNGRFVVPGLGAYRLMANEGDWSLKEITRQIEVSRQTPQTAGQAYYRAGTILSNTKSLKNVLTQYYPYPAKLPPMTWSNHTTPSSPVIKKVYRDASGFVTLEWESTDPNHSQTYTVYESSNDRFDVKDATSIVATGIRGHKIQLQTPDVNEGVYYTVTASDRFHNESLPCNSAFFILSLQLQK